MHLWDFDPDLLSLVDLYYSYLLGISNVMTLCGHILLLEPLKILMLLDHYFYYGSVLSDCQLVHYFSLIDLNFVEMKETVFFFLVLGFGWQLLSNLW